MKMKKTNFIFLTTLSVYLSLLLAGTSPTVYALNKQDFQTIADERDAQFLAFLDKDLCDAILTFLQEIKDIKATENNQDIESWEKFCLRQASSSLIAGEKTLLLEALTRLYKRIKSRISDFAEHSEKENCKENRIRVTFSDEGLNLYLQYSKKSETQAVVSANYINQRLLALSSASEIQKIIYENTKAISKDNHVLVITCLPRACIEQILSKIQTKSNL
jgi:predicted nucleic acid-binding protein